MKRWILQMGLALFVCAPLLYGDLVIVQRVEEGAPNKKSFAITIKIKGEKVRADLSPEISVIMDAVSGETITLHHGQKTCLVVSAAAAARALKEMDQLRDKKMATSNLEEPPKIESTGKHETISGLDTAIYTSQIGDMKITWWIASKCPESEKYFDALDLLRKTSMVKLAGCMAVLQANWKFPGVPLKTEAAFPDNRKVTFFIVSLKETPLQDIDFAIPSDYHFLPKPQFAPSLPAAP